MVPVLLAGSVILLLIALAGALALSRLSQGNGGTGERAINANHHRLYLLVNNLVTIQDRGYQPVFPDTALIDEARVLLADYEEQLVGMPPRAPAAELPRPD